MKYHKEKKTDKKIKALFAWFDYECKNRRLSIPKILELIETWVDTLVDSEEYEAAEAFRKYRKGKIIRYIRLKKKGERTSKEKISLYWKIYKRKIRNKIF